MATPPAPTGRDLRRALLTLLRNPMRSLQRTSEQTRPGASSLLRSALAFFRNPLEKLTLRILVEAADGAAVASGPARRSW